MTSKTIKYVVAASAVILLAAGCNSAQPQANNQNSSPTQPTSLNQVPSNQPNNPNPPQQGMASSTSGGMRMPNIPAGDKPFFGSITSVSGSQITLSGRSRNSSTTVTTIINVTSSTQFQGGSQSSLAAGTRIAGYGTSNSDGSIDAVSVMVNPSFPGGHRGGNGMQNNGAAQPQTPQ